METSSEETRTSSAIPAQICLRRGSFPWWNRESLEAVKRALVKTLEEGYAETEAYLVGRDGTKIPTYLTQTRFLFKGEPCILGVGF